MEVAGLSIGAVALIGTFKDCIDLFSMITAARSLGRDAEILDTKLDVEKMLFLQWADRVGLVKPDGYDTRLDDPVTHQTVARVLSSVRTLLSEGKALQERYGLRPFEKYRDLAQITNGGDEASRSRMIRFLRDVEQIGTGRIISVSKNNTLVPDKTESNTKTKAYSTTDRFRWVVSDKDKFIGLVGELSYFNSRLNALVPGNVSSILSMTEEDLSNLRNTTKLNLIVEVAVGHQPPVVEAARRVINQNRILQRLWFRWIDDRRESVMDAHFKTLRWALNPPEGAMKWDDLCVWLQQGSGIFWLAGKPGSGKSTLMKYLYTNPRTRQLLGTWAKDFELIFADFFFYHLGMEEQKSQEGLLRGILFQVLDTDPLLIETVLPNMWREAIKTENEADHSLAMPSIVEMRTSILALCRDQCVKRKLFLMIDGLDEYNGRHMEAASFFQELGRSANVKILIASRPEPAFVAAFARSPKMNLQDLTREDVAEYINDTVTSHPYMAILSAMSPKGPKEIVNELITKASGVFLWVVLACRSILDGFADFDTISDLKARVDELPPELEDLFRHMLSKIVGRYREQGVKILRLIFDNQSKKEVDPVPTLGLALIDEYGLQTDFRGPFLSYLPQEQQYLKCMMMEGRLRSRCCGLLEIQNTSASPLGSRVAFMHRSVYEFLCMPEIWKWDFMRIDDMSFGSHAILCMMWTQLVQVRIGSERTCVDNALAHGFYAEIERCPSSTLAANFSRLQSALGVSQSDLTVFMAHRDDCQDCYKDLSLGLALAVEMGMIGLVKFALEKPKVLKHALIPADRPGLKKCTGSTSLDRGTRIFLSGCQRLNQINRQQCDSPRSSHTVLPMLYHATYKPLLHTLRNADVSIRDGFLGLPTVAMIQYLLNNGHNPNEVFYPPKRNMATTPWAQWLRYDGRDHVDDSTAHQLAEITKLLVEAGAHVSRPGTSEFRKMKRGISTLARGAWEGGTGSPENWAHLDGLWDEVRDIIKGRLVMHYGPSAAAIFESNP